MDITKCFGQDCPIKEKCYRFTAESEPLYQSYFVETPGKWSSNAEFEPDSELYWYCEMFWGEKNNQVMDVLNSIFDDK